MKNDGPRKGGVPKNDEMGCVVEWKQWREGGRNH